VLGAAWAARAGPAAVQGPVCARPMCARRPLLRVLLLAASLSIVAGATARPTLRTGTTNGATNGNIRRAVLCTLAVQNACQMLSMRYSRMPGQPKYLTSTAVVTAEATKIVAAFIVMLYNSRGRAFAEVWQGVFVDWRDTILVGVPAFLYLIQNNLLYVATTHLDAATCQAPPVCPTTCRRGRAPWRVEQACSCSTLGARPGPQSTALPEQVAYQLKLLTTAFFSVTMLKRHISLRRCRRPPSARPGRHPPPACCSAEALARRADGWRSGSSSWASCWCSRPRWRRRRRAPTRRSSAWRPWSRRACSPASPACGSNASSSAPTRRANQRPWRPLRAAARPRVHGAHARGRGGPGGRCVVRGATRLGRGRLARGQVSIWLRSIQLGLVSLVLGLGSAARLVDRASPALLRHPP
jgi:hypothetical protein